MVLQQYFLITLPHTPVSVSIARSANLVECKDDVVIYHLFVILIDRYWEIITELDVNHFYTTPSVIRKLMSNDKEAQSSYSLSSLRIIASGS